MIVKLEVLHAPRRERTIHDDLSSGGGIGILKVALDGVLERNRVGPNDLSNLLLVLEQVKRRHGADRQFLSHLGNLVDVDLVERDGGVSSGEPNFVSVSNDEAW